MTESHHPTTGSSTVFMIVFPSVLGLTVCSLVASLYLAALTTPSEQVDRLIEVFSTTWQMGFGTVVGLIGGKVLQ